MAVVNAHWRRKLRRELTGLVALKVAALALLWWLFFSPPHHTTVDAEAASRRFATSRLQAVHPAAPQRALREENRRD
jgi:type II secretory pathway component PulM